MIDKIGGIGPSYGPRKSEPAAKATNPATASDKVQISEEASRAADAARVSRMAKTSEDTSRAEKLKEVKEKLARGDYDNLSDEVLDQIGEKLTGALLSRIEQ